jgi:hypothetical protein
MQKYSPMFAKLKLLKTSPLFCITLLLLCISFPEVIFGPASLMISDYFPMDGTPAQTINILPESSMQINQGFFDIGGAMWQSESKIPYMEHVLKEGKSIYWNPFLGAGSLGPETLVDVKTSPITFVAAMLGSSSAAVSFTILFFLGLGMFSMLSLCVKLLHLPYAAGIAAALAYAFNGFQTSGLGANYTQSYLLFPAYLYALCVCIQKPSIPRFILAVGPAALILSITFMPTTVLTMMCCSGLALGYAIHLRGDGVVLWKRILLIGCVPLLALLLLSFIYAPLVGALMLTADASAYAQRNFYPATINALLSVFTPKHFWNSYVTMDAFLYEPNHPAFTGNVVFHIGLIGGLCCLFAFSRQMFRTPVLLFAVMLAALMLMRIFAVPFYTDLVDKIPLISSFGQQYVWNGFMVCLPILVGYGAAQWLRMQPSHSKHIFIYIGFISLCLLYLSTVFPFEHFTKEKKLNLIWLACMLVAMTLVAVWMRRQRFRMNLPLVMLILMFVDYTFYINHLRPIARDVYNHPPAYVEYLKEHSDKERILNISSVGIPAEEAAAFQLYDVSQLTMNVYPGYEKFYNDYLLPKSYKFLIFLTFLQAKDVPELPLNIASFMGIRHILIPSYWVEWPKFLEQKNMPKVYSDDRISIYENPKVWPRAFMLPESRYPLKIEDIQQGKITAKNVSAVNFDETDYTRTIMNVSVKQKSVLVLTDSWHPYWKAKVGDEEVEVEALFGAFRAVHVPAGEHTITFYYDNPMVTLGKKLSLAGFAILAALVVYGGFRRFASSRVCS